MIRDYNSQACFILIMFLNFRKMYWGDWGASPKIEQANMDGTDRTTLVSSGLARVNSLALDYKNKLLYWCDAQLDKIERMDLHGNTRDLILNLTLPMIIIHLVWPCTKKHCSGQTGGQEVCTSTT